MNHFMDGLRRFSDFKGRTAKAPFWYFILFSIIINVVVGFIAGLLNLQILSTVVGLILLVPTLAIGARRMHDIGKSGWYYLIPLYDLYLALQDSEPAANKWGDVPPQS